MSNYTENEARKKLRKHSDSSSALDALNTLIDAVEYTRVYLDYPDITEKYAREILCDLSEAVRKVRPHLIAIEMGHVLILRQMEREGEQW